MDNKLLTHRDAAKVINLAQPYLRSKGSKDDLRLGQALMYVLSTCKDTCHLYDKLVKEGDIFYTENDELTLETFYKVCVEGCV